MDWNHDGKYDWKDHAFYNNVISNDGKKRSSQSTGNHSGKNRSSYDEGNFGCGWMKWLLIIWVVDIIIKLLGD